MTRLLTTLQQDIVDSALFEEAITHRSANKKNNERLEYLGDAILGFVVAEYLYAHKPDSAEGELSRLRAHLVRKDTLAEIAVELELGEIIKLGPGEMKSGGRRRDTTLADALEAIFAAVYLLKGLEHVRRFILDVYHDRLVSLPPGEQIKDPKSRLQEFLQSKNLSLPAYELSEVEGASHAQHFSTLCTIEEYGIRVTGEGASKRKSEQDAACKALALLEQRE
ncbi:MAG: ribonuclease III [Gammaproteobacteria bacterium]